MRLPHPLLLALTCIGFHAITASEPGSGRVEVRLLSGETVLGLLVGEDAQSVTVRRSMRSRSGTATADIPYQRSDIAEVLDLNQAYQEQAAHAGTSLTAQLALAHWCVERELADKAATHAIAAMIIDHGNEEGRGLLGKLGYIQVGVAWVKEDDYLDRHGLARYLDRIYSIADKQRIVTVHAAQVAAEALLSDKQQLLDRIQAGIALDQKSLAGDKKKADDLDTDSKDKATKLAACQKTVDDDQKKLDAANKAATAKNGNRRSTGPSEATIQAQKQAQQDLAEAKATVTDLQAAIDKDKASKAELATHDKHVSDEIEAQTKQATTLTAEVAAATEEVAKTKQATDDVIAHATPVSLPSS
jgi:hypothetical protein